MRSVVTMTLNRNYRPTTNYKLLSALTFGLHEETIKVRVIRRWGGMSYRNSDEIATHFILLDEEDSQNLALTQPPEMPRLMAELHEGMVYYITNFKIVVGPTRCKPVSAERAILFNKHTQARLCYDSYSIAKIKFVLSPFPPLHAPLENMEALIDVSGVLYDVGNISHSKHGIQKLSIHLIDESGVVITISLLGIQATQFDLHYGVNRKRNVVLVVTGLLTKCGKGCIWLASTSATKLYFDPAYKELDTLGDIIASKYGEFTCQLPSIEAYENLYPIGVQKIYLTLKQFREPDAWVRPKLMHNQAFFCTVTIKDVLSCEKWCLQPVHMEGVPRPTDKTYRCCSCHGTFIPVCKRSETIILAADSTADAKLTIKTVELEQLVGQPILQLLTHCENKHVHREVSPSPRLKGITDTLCTFEVEPPTNAEAASEFIIKSIVKATKLVEKRKSEIKLVGHVTRKLRQAIQC